jgi:hypothetical protein
VAKGDESEGESSFGGTKAKTETPVEKTETTNTTPTIDDSSDDEMPF